MKTLACIMILLLCSASPFTGNLHLKLLKGEPGNNQLSYLIYSSEKTYTYSEADSISGKYFVTRQIAAQKFKIIDTIIAPNIDEQGIIEAYLHPGKKILYSRTENESEPTFQNWGFTKRVTIRTTESFCRYEDRNNLKSVTTSSGIQSETKTNFYFWSLLILLVIFALGDWVLNLIYTILKKERVYDAFEPATAFFRLVLIIACIASIYAALTHGWQFSLVSSVVFLIPVPLELRRAKLEAKSIAKEKARRAE